MLDGVILNAQVLRKLKPFTAGRVAGKTRYILRAVYVEDCDGARVYAATDGRVLACYKDEHPKGGALAAPACVVPAQKIKAGSSDFVCKDVDESTVLLVNEEEKIAADLLPADKYPNWRATIPPPSTPKAREFTLFAPALLSKASGVVPLDFVPQMAPASGVALWDKKPWQVVVLTLSPAERAA